MARLIYITYRYNEKSQWEEKWGVWHLCFFYRVTKSISGTLSCMNGHATKQTSTEIWSTCYNIVFNNYGIYLSIGFRFVFVIGYFSIYMTYLKITTDNKMVVYRNYIYNIARIFNLPERLNISIIFCGKNVHNDF